MSEGYKYGVVGAGRQGTAAAYDMIKWGGAASVLLADADGDVATRAAERINTLFEQEVATSAQAAGRLPVRRAFQVHHRLHARRDPGKNPHG
jgi:3-hydroxyacyl-CoA dehydrogenase